MQIEITEEEFATLRSLFQKIGVVIAAEEPAKETGWGSKRDAARLLGCSIKEVDRLRKDGTLQEHIHWHKKTDKQRGNVYLYLPLIKDWAANRHDPQAHQKAIDAYVRSLPSNTRRKRG